MMAEPHRLTFRERRYAMKLHRATRLHFDLRFEFNGFLLSWALPADLNCMAGIFHDAVEMEDHRSENLTFEGVHRTGPIMLWDEGTWEPLPECENVEDSLRRGVLHFILRGKRMEGAFTITRTNRISGDSHPVWMLSKQADIFAQSTATPRLRDKWPTSVDSGRTMDEIVEAWAKPPKRRNQGELF